MELQRCLTFLILIAVIVLIDGDPDGCPDGSYFDNSTNKCTYCTANCKECMSAAPTTCKECKNKFFLSSGVCIACNDTNCLQCSTFETCIRCDQRYFLTLNDSCELCDNNCFMCTDTNNCTVCQTRYYINENGVCNKCPDKCNVCKNETSCTTCDANHYIVNGECKSCGTTCLKCDVLGHCTECADGYWGGVCNITCVPECNGRCDQSTGKCRCNSASAKGGCDVHEASSNVCSPGYYSDTCKEPCIEENCTNSICFQNNGTCIEYCPSGCVSCNSTTHCYVCQNGYYGNTCQHDCRTCRGDKCSKGNCTFGCKSGYYPDGKTCKKCDDTCTECTRNDTCTKCIDGRYGTACQDECDTKKCAACERFSNNCTKCTSEFILQAGNTCCPVNCSTCDDQGNCLTCKEGLYGKTCSSICDSKCKTCTTKDNCTECDVGKFDSKVSFGQCLCDQKQCNESEANGNCTKCKDEGWFLLKNGCCPCPINCKLQGKCSAFTGKCKNGCQPGWWGTFCNKICTVKQCIDCTNGFCKLCEDGLYGDKCQNVCSRNCSQIPDKRACDTKSGLCIFGCTNGTWGPSCEHSCSENCLNRRCNSSSGECLSCRPMLSGRQCTNEQRYDDEEVDNSLVPIMFGVVASIFVLCIVIIAAFVIRRRHIKHKDKQSRQESVLHRNTDAEGHTPTERTKRKADNDGEIITENDMYEPFQGVQATCYQGACHQGTGQGTSQGTSQDVEYAMPVKKGSYVQQLPGANISIETAEGHTPTERTNRKADNDNEIITENDMYEPFQRVQATCHQGACHQGTGQGTSQDVEYALPVMKGSYVQQLPGANISIETVPGDVYSIPLKERRFTDNKDTYI